MEASIIMKRIDSRVRSRMDYRVAALLAMTGITSAVQGTKNGVDTKNDANTKTGAILNSHSLPVLLRFVL